MSLIRQRNGEEGTPEEEIHHRGTEAQREDGDRNDQGEIIEIIKRSKAVANLVPKNASQRKVLLDCTPSPHPIPMDLDDPVDVEWEAMK